jgi:hypothetical protein
MNVHADKIKAYAAQALILCVIIAFLRPVSASSNVTGFIFDAIQFALSRLN